MSSHATHIRCELVNVEAISQSMGTESNRFNPLRLLPLGIEGNKSKNPKYGKLLCVKYKAVYHLVSMNL